jgi:hypothetical protein
MNYLSITHGHGRLPILKVLYQEKRVIEATGVSGWTAIRARSPGSQNKFSILRKLLGAIGLSPEAVDDIIDRILDFLSDKGRKSPEGPKYPYVLSSSFLSPAEHNFFGVLKTTVADQAIINIKIGLGDLFDVRSKDHSEFRIYHNKINPQAHPKGFLLCDPKTVRPLAGIELDDKSHQRSDR